MYSNLLLYSDQTPCLKSLNLDTNTIETYAGSCTKNGTIDGPRLKARLQMPRGLLRVGDVIYIVDESTIRVIDLWDGRLEYFEFTHNITTVFEDTENLIKSPGYMTTCDGEKFYLTADYGVIEINISQGQAKFLMGNNTHSFSDTDPENLYQNISTSVFSRETRGIIALAPEFLVVAGYQTNRLRAVFPVLNELKEYVNVTVSLCSDHSIPKEGNLENCVLGHPYSLFLFGGKILIGVTKGMRIITANYQDVYKKLNVDFGEAHMRNEFGKLNLSFANDGALGAYSASSHYPGKGVWTNGDEAVDGNPLTYFLSDEKDNQWYKIWFFATDEMYLDKIRIYWRNTEDCEERDRSGVSIFCYELMRPFHVLTSSLVAEDKNREAFLIPEINSTTWTTCYYRYDKPNVTQNGMEEITTCGEDNIKQVAFYVEQNGEKGIAIRELEIYRRRSKELDFLITSDCDDGVADVIIAIPAVNLIKPAVNLTSSAANLTTSSVNLTTPSVNLTIPTSSIATPAIKQKLPAASFAMPTTILSTKSKTSLQLIIPTLTCSVRLGVWSTTTVLF